MQAMKIIDNPVTWQGKLTFKYENQCSSQKDLACNGLVFFNSFHSKR